MLLLKKCRIIAWKWEVGAWFVCVCRVSLKGLAPMRMRCERARRALKWAPDTSRLTAASPSPRECGRMEMEDGVDFSSCELVEERNFLKAIWKVHRQHHYSCTNVTDLMRELLMSRRRSFRHAVQIYDLLHWETYASFDMDKRLVVHLWKGLLAVHFVRRPTSDVKLQRWREVVINRKRSSGTFCSHGAKPAIAHSMKVAWTPITKSWDRQFIFNITCW